MNQDKNLIYYIEDEPDLLELCRVSFEMADYRLEGFSDGEEFAKAMEKIVSGEKKLPGVFIIDILLPGISGMEILKKLRSHREFDEIHALIFTNYSSEEYKKEAEKYPNTQYILKTDLIPSQLVENVSKLIGKK